MNTRLSVATARTALERYVRSSSEFIPYLNQAMERLLYSGKWKGAVVKVTFDASLGYITLPPDMLSILAGTYCGVPSPVFDQFYHYYESGPGTYNDALQWGGVFSDQGDGFPTQFSIIEAEENRFPPVVAVPGSVQLFSSASDNGKAVRLFGIEEETGRPVFDSNGVEGEQLILSSPSVISTKHYSRVTGVEKLPTNSIVTAWCVPSGGGDSYQLATWLPWETMPQYRRYWLKSTEHVIQTLCQRRFMPVSAETDPVYPDSLAALKFALKALVHEDQGYEEIAMGEWDAAINWLNQEATASRGGAKPSNPINTWGMGTPFPYTW